MEHIIEACPLQRLKGGLVLRLRPYIVVYLLLFFVLCESKTSSLLRICARCRSRLRAGRGCC